jgi:phenylpropionate dioxygenase-like ring-hydroxylating dioxygenase large terminal subunit
VWVFIPSETTGEIEVASLPPVPTVVDFGKSNPKIAETLIFDCHIDHAVIGLMDPAHGPYVHTSWWWRSGPRQFRVKEKVYEPVPMGFRLAPYEMPVSAKPYKILGNKVSIEIVFQLPSVRAEILRGDRHRACAFTAITPTDENHCEVHQSLYYTIPWLAPLTPLLRYLSIRFLDQDRDVVIKQQEGLEYDPALMLIDDADTQAKWYFRLKQEYERARAEGREFVNPVRTRVLRWRS